MSSVPADCSPVPNESALTSAAASSSAASAPPPSKKKAAEARKKARLAEASHQLLARSISLIGSSNPHWGILLSPGSGRSGVAKRPLQPGTTVVHERAAGWRLRSDEGENQDHQQQQRRWRRCAYCCQLLPKDHEPSPCCGVDFFCQGCESLAAPLHRFVCPFLPHIPALAAAAQCEEDLLALVATLIANHCLEQSSQPVPNATVTASESSEPALKMARWEHVQDLVCHLDSADADWRSAIEDGMLLLREAYNDPEITHGIFDDLQLPDVKTMVELCSRINSNSHAIFDNESGSNSVIGMGLFPITSILNHSCYPNAFFSATGCAGEMIVRTIRPIAEGEEITVPYIDLYQPRWDRLMELHKDKAFWCTCRRCKAEEARKASKTEVSPQSSAIEEGRIQSWLGVGGIYCPRCKAKAGIAPSSSTSAAASSAFKDNDLGVNASNKFIKDKKKRKEAEESTSAATFFAGTSAPIFPSTVGLVFWRGSSEEIRQSLTNSDSTPLSSWQCSRANCGTKYTHAEIDSNLNELYQLFQEGLACKQQGRSGECLSSFDQLLAKSSTIIPPTHALLMSVLIPAMNIARSLDKHQQVVRYVTQIVQLMEDVFPSNLPELSEFYVTLAQAHLDIARQPNSDTTVDASSVDVQFSQQKDSAKLAYFKALDIRTIACGPTHPRTLAIPEEYRTLYDKVAEARTSL